METNYTPAAWIAFLNNPTQIIEGHSIKTAAPPHTPIAILPAGGGTHGKETQIFNARLIAASPALMKALMEIAAIGDEEPQNLHESQEQRYSRRAIHIAKKALENI